MGNLLGCVQVDQSTVAIRGKWGKFDKVLEPGCHCLPWYFGKRIVGRLSLCLHEINVHCKTKTKDNVYVTVVASIQFRVLADKANDAYFKLRNIHGQIDAYAYDVISTSVPKLNLGSIEQKNKKDIAKDVESTLKKAMTPFGYEIVRTRITGIRPNEIVLRAMSDINTVASMRVAAIEAETEKMLQIKTAEGDAESKYLAGVGIARQYQAIVDGLRDSTLDVSSNALETSSNDVMDMVLITQYFDTMKEIGAPYKSPDVFIPHGPDAIKGIAS